MLRLHKRIEQIWWNPCRPPLLLRCIEPVYTMISRIHMNRRAKRSISLPLPLISVGNITAGGSGKTPFVLWLADVLKQLGYAPVILCRGDGGKTPSPVVVSPDSDVAVVGDEAKMLAEMSGCPVIAAADRTAVSDLVSGLGNILILDDGFQYRHLERCCDIVLVPAEGTGNGHLIPAGPLREPLSSLNRADIIVRTGSQTEHDDCQALGKNTEWHWTRNSGSLIDVSANRTGMPDCVYAVTSIARPQRFFHDLESGSLKLAGYQSYPDHHPFTEQDVCRILRLHPDIAVTAKDAVKLRLLWPDDRPLWVLPVRGSAQPGLLDTIKTCLPHIKHLKNKTPPTRDGV